MLAHYRRSDPRGEEGFTLIELLVVIIIIGILAAIAIPVFLNQRQKGYDAAVTSDLKNAATAQETYYNDSASTGVYADAVVPALTNAPVGFRYSAGSNYQGGVRSRSRGQAVRCRAHRRHGDTALANGGFCLQAVSASGLHPGLRQHQGRLHQRRLLLSRRYGVRVITTRSGPTRLKPGRQPPTTPMS